MPSAKTKTIRRGAEVALFVEYGGWEVLESTLEDFMQDRINGSVYEAYAGSVPKLFLIRFNTLPWTLLVSVAPRGSALCTLTINRSLLKNIYEWGRDAIQDEGNFKSFCKEIGQAGLKRENLPIPLFTNIATYGSYLGRKSLIFGRGGYCQEWHICNGIVVPNEWLGPTVGLFEKYLQNFPLRSFVGLTGDAFDSEPMYDKASIGSRLGSWAMSMHDFSMFKSLDAIHGTNLAGEFESEEDFVDASFAWLERAVESASGDVSCSLDLVHQDMIRLHPNMRNGLTSSAHWLELKSDRQYEIYLLRAKLIFEMKCPHHFPPVLRHYNNLVVLDDARVMEMCGYLKGYLDSMAGVAPYLSDGFSPL
jgi:hypothetical protein